MLFMLARSISLHDAISLSTIQNNWSLGNLGRQDTNKTVSSALYPPGILGLNLIYIVCQMSLPLLQMPPHTRTTISLPITFRS